MKGVCLLIIFALYFHPFLFAQKKVNTLDAVKIGGIQQCIEVRGKDDTKPVLLFIHGGPGFSSRLYSKKLIKKLDHEFIVVQWDQRESGNTAYWSPIKDSLTVEMFHNDTYEVVQYLLKRFNRKKIFLVGYSWGGFLGLHFANQHPELLHAYVSVSGIIHGEESEKLNLKMLKEKADDYKNEEARNELSKIKLPHEDWESLFYQRKWAAFFSGGDSSKKSYPQSLFQEWARKWLSVFQEASEVNFFEVAPSLNCPVYFFISDKDYVANHTVAEEYYNHVKAEKKQIVWFTNSTHEIPTDEPEKFSEELIKIGKNL